MGVYQRLAVGEVGGCSRVTDGGARGHSTATDLLKAHSDIIEALDEGSMTTLNVFDSSAIFK